MSKERRAWCDLRKEQCTLLRTIFTAKKDVHYGGNCFKVGIN